MKVYVVLNAPRSGTPIQAVGFGAHCADGSRSNNAETTSPR